MSLRDEEIVRLLNGSGGSTNQYFEDGRPYAVCQNILGHQFVISVVCREGYILYFDVYDNEVTKSFLSHHLKQQFRDWIVEFCRVTRFCGAISFEFVVEDLTGLVFCVGCKPTLDIGVIKRYKSDQVIE